MKILLVLSFILIGCTIYQVNDISECVAWKVKENNNWVCTQWDIKFECRTLGYGHGQKVVCSTKEQCIKACDKLRRKQ